MRRRLVHRRLVCVWSLKRGVIDPPEFECVDFTEENLPKLCEIEAECYPRLDQILSAADAKEIRR